MAANNLLPEPFAYPKVPHTRLHGPRGYGDYSRYKPYLRDEFLFRCVYCLEREMWYPDRSASFSVDHLMPKHKAPELINYYDNLVYACTRCNAAKQDHLMSLNPTNEALGHHLRVDPEGRIEGLTPQGMDLIDLFHLAIEPACAVRRYTLLILQAKREQPDNATIHEIFENWFRFPPDLPDLKLLKPPGRNDREPGIKNCHYEKRERRELPECY